MIDIFHFLMPILLTLCAREKTRSEELDRSNGVVSFIQSFYFSNQCHYSYKIMLNLNTTEGVILDLPPQWQEWLDTSQVAVSAVGKYLSSHTFLVTISHGNLHGVYNNFGYKDLPLTTSPFLALLPLIV